MQKIGMPLFTADTEKFFLERSGTLSGAGIEAVLIRSGLRSPVLKKVAVDKEDLQSALKDFIPPYYPTEIELQNLVVLECTSRSLLPQKYREMERRNGKKRVDPSGQ